MSDSRCRLSLRVASRTRQASEISAAFNDPPFRSVEVGERFSPRVAAVAKESYCVWRCPLEHTATPDDHIDWVVAFLAASSEHALPAGLEIDIRLSLSPHAWQTCFAVDGRSMRILGALDAQLNIDVYSNGEEDEELTISDAV